jgi:UDP-N-acetylglucosamine--N-acetylmuramyl-(pentapeptide) pyrophosphoryl-undecaprenol N-acetylglucosamine transferase
MPEPSPTWALIAGGGTAGHTLPGIAVARALVAAGHPAESIHFVGSERGSETRLVPEAGFTLTALPGRGIQRKLTFANVGAVVGLFRAFWQALALVRRRRPSVVVALGGYASVACAMAAVLHRVPIVVAEQNAVPGAANRLVARFAKASAVTFPGTDLPRAVVTGNPVRPEVLAVDRARDRGPARARLGLPDDRVVVVSFGGSLGARRINRAVTGLVERWAGRTDLAVRHVVGERDWDDSTARGEERNGATGILYRPVRYEDDMPTTLAAADVVVARAGATTVAELAVLGLPSILVPLPIATADHQTANARHLVDLGAARLVPDAELDVDRLEAELGPLVTDPDELARMGDGAHRLGRRDAAEQVAALVEEHARDRDA